MADKADKGKKRKRNTDGTSKPSKRLALDADKQVKISHHEAEKWAPVIASTPGIAIPTSIPLKPYTKSRKNAPQRLGRSGDIATKELLLHSSAHPKLDYIAREEEAGGSDVLLKHYVGVYDPETGKLEIMEARKVVVRGSVRAHQATIEDEVSTNMRELRNALGQTFGTKKARKAIASVTENAISPDKSARQANGATKLDSASAAMIANMAATTAGMSTQAQLQEAADAAKPRPKANLNATEVKDVYTVDSLVGLDTMKLVPVRQWQEMVKSGKQVFVNSRHVAERIVNAAMHGVEKLKLLRYMLLLIEFYNACHPTRGGRKLPRRDETKKILGDMPEAVLEGIKRKFSDAGVMSKFKVDLLITHLCALALLVDNYEVDMYNLKEDLKLETKPMEQYFREIGAKTSALSQVMAKSKNLDKVQAAQRKMAKLKLPLDFPKVGFGRRK